MNRKTGERRVEGDEETGRRRAGERNRNRQRHTYRQRERGRNREEGRETDRGKEIRQSKREMKRMHVRDIETRILDD